MKKEKDNRPEVNQDNQTEPGKPRVDPEKYYKDSGIFDRFKDFGITIRFTDSLEAMKRQHDTGWDEYLKHYKEQAEKYGIHVEEADIQLARKNYVEYEVNVFTGLLAGRSPGINELLAGSLGINEKIEIQKHLKDLKKELDRLADGKQKTGLKYFTWTGSPEQLDALYERLKEKEAGYIDPETGKEAFIKIFSGREIDNDLHRVTWIKRTRKSKSIAKNAVTTMFDLLAKNGKISNNETKNKAEYFRKLNNCFCDQAGNPLKFEYKNLSYSKDHGNQLKQIITSL
ncbi:MAG: hypothetical protein EOM90_05710 [Alphaproteobacteria bacterium]|nr:hypothetical protein [Alphaproteobacteria bacterium]